MKTKEIQKIIEENPLAFTMEDKFAFHSNTKSTSVSYSLINSWELTSDLVLMQSTNLPQHDINKIKKLAG